MSFSIAVPWSSGEEEMHRLMHVPDRDNPTSAMLTPQAAFMLQRAPLLALGAIDAHGNPWTTIWGGSPAFSRDLGSGLVGTRTIVDAVNDPVVQILVGGRDDGEVVNEEGAGRMIGGLSIDLMTRKRVKIFGRMVAGALSSVGPDESTMADVTSNDNKPTQDQAEIQLVIKVEQSLGNCPKYLNKKEIRPALPSSKLLSSSLRLSPEALELLKKADLFFISSSNSVHDMDTNHRGGPPGFVRVLSNDETGAELVYPEYSGNRLYQTLGNLKLTPRAGLVFPDFETGNVLYVTGSTEILIGPEANNVLPRSNLVVKVKIQVARLVEAGLPFRGTSDEFSPYNPNVRILAKEGNIAANVEGSKKAANIATLLKKTRLTPTINRYRFSTTTSAEHKPGQWVALDFSDELDMGYSHMRDDDPKSLNDDFIRTFTVSSPPPPAPSSTVPNSNTHVAGSEFEITIRKIGPVTEFLDRLNDRSGLEVPIRGLGGDFHIDVTDDAGFIPFIAGGVGITPLLAHLPSLIPFKDRLHLIWSVRAEDLGLVLDTVQHYPAVASRTALFVTNWPVQTEAKSSETLLHNIKTAGVARVETRRIQKDDLMSVGTVKKYYLCAGKQLRTSVLAWLEGKNVVFEDFDY